MVALALGLILPWFVWLFAWASARGGHHALALMLVLLGLTGLLVAWAGLNEAESCFTVLEPEPPASCESAHSAMIVALVVWGLFGLVTVFVAVATLATLDATSTPGEQLPKSVEPDLESGAREEIEAPTTMPHATYRGGLVGILERVSDHLGIGFDDARASAPSEDVTDPANAWSAPSVHIGTEGMLERLTERTGIEHDVCPPPADAERPSQQPSDLDTPDQRD